MIRFKTFFYLVCLVSSLAFAVWASGEHKKYRGNKYISVLTDVAGDSTFVAKTLIHIGEVKGFKTLQARIIMDNAVPTNTGLGNQDSCWLWLYTYLTDGQPQVIDSAVQNSFPCTLYTVIPEAVGDTLLKYDLHIGYQVYDSLGDEAITTIYPIKYDIRLK